jgi:4-hydroxy-2-oxoheptanedioate aldolase
MVLALCGSYHQYVVIKIIKITKIQLRYSNNYLKEILIKYLYIMETDTCTKRDKPYLFKQELKKGTPKLGIFLNSASPVIAEQLSFGGYDWLLIDMQHGPINFPLLGQMIKAVANGNALSMVRVAGYHDREGIQQALDLGADGILVPYINSRKEAEEALSVCFYPPEGTRSMGYPLRKTFSYGMGYLEHANKNVVVALQVETASCIDNIEDIMSLPGIDIAFLGQNDLCMSMGLYEKYKFPEMYTSVELNEATQKMVDTCQKHGKICGVFLFGTDRVGEFMKKGFTFISVGNDLHHVLTQSTAHITKVEEIAKESGKEWKQNSK